MQDYPPPMGANGKARASIPTYPMTLLWYLRIRLDPDSWEFEQFCWQMAEESLLPAKRSSPGFQRYSSTPPRGGPTAAQQRLRKLLQRLLCQSKQRQTASQKEAHKRQISQAIPRNERDNGELSRPKAAPASSRSTTVRPHRALSWTGSHAERR